MVMIMAIGIMLTRVLVDMIWGSHCRERESCALETLPPATLPVLDILMRFERGLVGVFCFGRGARRMSVVFCLVGDVFRRAGSTAQEQPLTTDSADLDITFTGWTNYNPGK
jgi:hypothetical protein